MTCAMMTLPDRHSPIEIARDGFHPANAVLLRTNLSNDPLQLVLSVDRRWVAVSKRPPTD